jgi:acyl-CoA thioesterase-1
MPRSLGQVMNKKRSVWSKNGSMHSVLPFLFLGLTSATLLARTPSAIGDRAQTSVPTVLVLGDSLSAGYGLKRSEAYPALLAEKAAASGRQIKVLNAGISGDTTAGGLRRLPRLLGRRVDVLIVELGINDLFLGVPMSVIESNLQEIIDQVRARYPEVRIVVAGMQPPPSSAEGTATAFGALYVELAKRNHAELVPFLLDGVAGNPQFNLPDLIHPNVRGQKVLAANVWPALENALEQLGETETRFRPNEF